MKNLIKMMILFFLTIFLIGCSDSNLSIKNNYVSYKNETISLENSSKIEEILEKKREKLKEEIKQELEQERIQEEEKLKKIEFENSCILNFDGVYKELKIISKIRDFKNIDKQIEIMKENCLEFYKLNSTLIKKLENLEILRINTEKEIEEKELETFEFCISELENLEIEINKINSKVDLEEFNDKFSKVQDNCNNKFDLNKDQYKKLASNVDELRDNKLDDLK